jgi:hypothetical protein
MEIKKKQKKGIRIFTATILLIFFSNLILFLMISHNEDDLNHISEILPADHIVMKINAELKTKYQEELPIIITNLRRTFVVKGFLIKDEMDNELESLEPQSSYLVSIPNNHFDLLDNEREKLLIFPANINIRLTQTKGKTYEIIF